MSELRTKLLLREWIKQVVNEEYGGLGGDYAGLGLDPMAGMPYGMHYASNDQLYKIFVKPFVDVIGVTAGKASELSVKAQSVLKVTFESVMTTLLPFLSSNYSEIFVEERKRLDKIKSEYADVYNATWEAFNEADVMIAAFMYRPDLFLTSKIAANAPKLASHLLEIVTGGAIGAFLSRMHVKLHGLQHRPFHKPQRQKPLTHFLKGARPHYTRDEYEERMAMESTIHESEEKKEREVTIEQLLKSKKVREMIAQNTKLKEMAVAGQQITNTTLSKVVSEAQAVLGAKSLEDLTHKLGKRIPGLEKISQLPEQERAAASQNILATAKKSMKEFYVKQLQGQAKSAVESGLSQDHPFVQAYTSTISKIKSM
jgi:hypothetical protein